MAKKKMTAEMTEPFVWPEVPESLEPYVIPLYFLSYYPVIYFRVGIERKTANDVVLIGIQLGTKPVLRN